MNEDETIKYSYDDGLIISKDKTIKLSYRENEIMKILIHNRGEYTNRFELAKVLFGEDGALYYEPTISVYVSRLRTKLKGVIQIHNRQGHGYKIKKTNNTEEYSLNEDTLYKF